MEMKSLIVVLIAGMFLLAGCAGENANKIQNTPADGGLTKINVTGSVAKPAPLEISTQPTVYFFYLTTCGYSQGQIRDVNGKLKSEFPQVRWEEYEVTNPGARMRWYEMMGARNATPKGVPVTIIGQDVISGYYPGETETKIRAAIKAEIARVEKKG